MSLFQHVFRLRKSSPPNTIYFADLGVVIILTNFFSPTQMARFIPTSFNSFFSDQWFFGLKPSSLLSVLWSWGGKNWASNSVLQFQSQMRLKHWLRERGHHGILNLLTNCSTKRVTFCLLLLLFNCVNATKELHIGSLFPMEAGSGGNLIYINS